MSWRNSIIITIVGVLICTMIFYQCRTIKDFKGESLPITHETWTELLQKNVKSNGRVDYGGFTEEKEKLFEYIQLLNSNHPNTKNWSKEERLAYWMNAYNAYTVQLIVENYPTQSIKDIKKGVPFINSVWDLKFINIEGQEYDLNNIEHNILRKKFDEPRIHFAINCASVSCPNLRNEAFVPERLDEQLSEQAVIFLNDTTKNIIQENHVQLSKIFSWFGKDFKKDGTLIDYINLYTEINIDKEAKVTFLEYDWNLNE